MRYLAALIVGTAVVAAAQDNGPAKAAPRILAPTPEYATPGAVNVRTWVTQNDLPNSDTVGNGVIVTEGGTIPRSNYAIGIDMRHITGGGCVPGPSGCLTETIIDSSGNPVTVTVMKRRERWMMEVTYTDPSTNLTTSLTGQHITLFELHTPGGHQCFSSIIDCDFFHFNYNPALQDYVAFTPSCSNNLGAGYTATVAYQFSRYDAGTVPAGAIEWLPTTPDTVFTGHFLMGPRADALRVSSPALLRPEIEAQTFNATGGTTQTLPPAEMTLNVDASECKGPISGVTFTLTATQVAGSGGHEHGVPGAIVDPPLAAFSDLPATQTGTTDANGHWQTTVHSGRFGGITSMVAQTNNIGIGTSPLPFSSKLWEFTTGFILSDYIPRGVSGDYVLLVGDGVACQQDGNGNYPCLNHRGVGHRGRPELHDFVDAMALFYNLSVNVTANNKGRIGVNDMSLPVGGRFDISGRWCCSHQSHRFGVDVDINHAVYDAAANPIGDLDEDKMDDIVDIVLNGQKLMEVNVHYRLPVAVIDRIIAEVNTP